MTPIDKALKAGTLNAIDRSRQYVEPNAGDLLRSLNEAWSTIRSMKAASIHKDELVKALREKLDRAKTVNVLLTLGILGLWKLVEFLVQLQLHR